MFTGATKVLKIGPPFYIVIKLPYVWLKAYLLHLQLQAHVEGGILFRETVYIALLLRTDEEDG